MKQEVVSAVDFITGILKKRNLGVKVDNFRVALEGILCSHYENHWFPDKPYKGSAYRCMRIVDGKMDQLIAKAGQQSGISESQLLNILPRELTMWVDPYEVSYRIGEDGSVGVIFDRQSGNHVETGEVDIPSRNSSPASLSSRTPSPVSPPTPVSTTSSPVYWHEQLQMQQQQQLRLQQHQQQQLHQQQYQQSQEFFPRYTQHQQTHSQQFYEPESSCRENSRSWFPDHQRTQSPASNSLTNWEYLATYVAS